MRIHRLGRLGLLFGLLLAPGLVAAKNSAKLTQILSSAPGQPVAYAKVVDLSSGEVVFSHNAHKRLTPASVSKMFTTAAVALKLPLQRKLHTDVLVQGLQGERANYLALRGGGDPSLTASSLRKLADAVKDKGVRGVKMLWIDSTLFDRKAPRGFDEKSSDASYRAPVDALNVDQGTVTVTVAPGKRPGAPAQVRVALPSAALVIDNKAVTTKGRANKLVVHTAAGAGGKTTVIVRGRIGVRRRRPPTVRKRVESAALHAGHAFRLLLAERGVKVAKIRWGRPRSGYKSYARIARRSSAPIAALMTYCNQMSHNGYAETFFKLLGAEVVGRPGTGAKGEAAIRQALKKAKIPWKDVKLGNGSGLYHANHVTADAVVALLKWMYKVPSAGERWRHSLAIGGVKGTLKHRLREATLEGKVYAKTGTLDDVTALAGYVLSKRGRFAFALFFNDVKRSASVYRRVHDRFLVTLLKETGAVGAKAVERTKEKKRAPKKRAHSSKR